MADDTGFVPLTSLKRGAPDPKAALAEIRRIYFKTSKKTIDNDMAHAIELLKSLPSEEEREKAAVYMEVRAQMRWYWGMVQGETGKGKGASEKGQGKRGKGEDKKQRI
jgi:hypothetical protein